MVPGIKSVRLQNILLLVAILGGYAIFFGWGMLRTQSEFCVFKSITGIPCPGCGMGRATQALMHGDMAASFFFHPLAIPFNVLIVSAVCWILVDVVRGRFTLLPRIKKRFSQPWIIATLCFIAILWVYNLLRGI